MSQNLKINPRSLASVLTICTVVCVFVAFCIGTFGASAFYVTSLNWAFCAPFLVFMISGLLLSIAKFVFCTIPLKKEYSSKDTINVQFFLEIICMVILLVACLTPAFMSVKEPDDYQKIVIAPILLSSLSLAITLACSGLSYHNYR